MMLINGEQKVIFAPHLRDISSHFTHLISGSLPPVKNGFFAQLIKFRSRSVGTDPAM